MSIQMENYSMMKEKSSMSMAIASLMALLWGIMDTKSTNTDSVSMYQIKTTDGRGALEVTTELTIRVFGSPMVDCNASMNSGSCSTRTIILLMHLADASTVKARGLPKKESGTIERNYSSITKAERSMKIGIGSADVDSLSTRMATSCLIKLKRKIVTKSKSLSCNSFSFMIALTNMFSDSELGGELITTALVRAKDPPRYRCGHQNRAHLIKVSEDTKCFRAIHNCPRWKHKACKISGEYVGNLFLEFAGFRLDLIARLVRMVKGTAFDRI